MKTFEKQEILRQLTEEEKISLTTGCGCWQTAAVPRLDVRSVTVADGPVGLRKEHNGATTPAVCFPSISKLACSFDPAVLREVGAAIGEQCRQEGVNVLLAPGLNVKRNPRCGRNFEYFSEDPLLTGELATAYVKGVQSQEVDVCVKHLAGNSQEYGRRVCDSVIDMRALREIYLSAFERVIKNTQPSAVMCAYNKLNGEYCSQNKWLLTDVLRGEWGFDGIVMSDWGATDDRVKGIAAGLDLQMPQGDTSEVAQALAEGTLSRDDLDKAVENVLQFAARFEGRTLRNADFNYQHHLERRISADCTVLVKNNCHLLPFDKKDDIALIGTLCETPYFQGGGSSKVLPYHTDNILQAFEQGEISFRYARGYTQDGQMNQQLLDEAQQLAAGADKVLLVVGGYGSESEGFDRASWKLPEAQLQVIDAVTSANSNVAIVLQCGAPVDVSWQHSAKAVLFDYLGGEYCGGGVFDVVFGNVNPTGRLAETWPIALPPLDNEYSVDYKRALYKESIFVGYRYYSTAGVEVAFPFGYGLNYNSFVWSDVSLNTDSVLPVGKVTVTLNVTNTGRSEDADTVQIYAQNLDGRSFYAKKNLVAFKKVRLKPGESKKVSIDVNVEDLASFDVNKGRFVVNGGRYLLTVAKNCNDDGTKLVLNVEAGNDTVDQSDTLSVYYNVEENFAPTEQQFIQLFGTLPTEEDLPFTISSPLCETLTKRFGKLIAKVWTKGMSDADRRNALVTPLIDYTYRNEISREMIFSIVAILNGERCYFKLFKQYLSNRRANKKRNK